MGITSLQVCMDSSDWLHQGTISEENNNNITGMESSAISPTMSDEEEDNNILTTCTSSTLPLIHERRSSIIRPQNQAALKCPRCDSTHTKFCYYNNYSLSQPRYFCKTCRRYWTKGGTLRNIPVGGGCRKNKKPTSKKSSNDHNHHPNNNYNNHHHQQSPPPPPSSSFPSHQQNLYCSTTRTGMLSPMLTNFGNNDSTELQLAFPDQIQYFSSGIFNTINPNLNHHGNFLLENPITPIDFLDNKYETLVGGGGSSSHDFMGNNNLGDNINLGGGLLLHSNNFHGINCSSSTAGTILESCQRLMQLPYHDEINNQELLMDVKPNPSKILSLDWHDSQQQQQQQACNSDAGISYLGGIGSWTGLINGYGTSNPLV